MVAEKPSVAKMIAEHLSGNRFRIRKGQSRANQIFEFIKYFGPAKQKCKIIVTSVVGHIYGLNFEASNTNYDCIYRILFRAQIARATASAITGPKTGSGCRGQPPSNTPRYGYSHLDTTSYWDIETTPPINR